MRGCWRPTRSLAASLLALSSAWLVWSRSFDWDKAFVQLALIFPLVWRRVHPTAVFVVMSAIAVAQWALGYRLVGDAALLVGLYTVAVHESRGRALIASAVMEIGTVMATSALAPGGHGRPIVPIPHGDSRSRAFRRSYRSVR